MIEVWSPIKGFEGLYLISSQGRVKSLKTKKILKSIENDCGHFRVFLYKNGRSVHYIHRLVAAAFLLNPNNLPEVNHKDFNKRNNNLDNLEWMTKLDNVKHQWENLKKIKNEQINLFSITV